jgi:hypothetical protein
MTAIAHDILQLWTSCDFERQLQDILQLVERLLQDILQRGNKA